MGMMLSGLLCMKRRKKGVVSICFGMNEEVRILRIEQK